MIDNALAMFLQAVTSVSGWFVRVFTSAGATNFYLSMIFLSLTFGYLLGPLLHQSRGSDEVKKK